MKNPLVSLLIALLLGRAVCAGSAGAVDLPLQNGWTNYPGTSNPEVFLVDGIVYFKGAISGGTSAGAFTLPPAMRPSTTVYIPISLPFGKPGHLIVQPSGEVSVESADLFADAQFFTSLDGASFAPIATEFTLLELSNGWTNAPFSTSPAAASLINDSVHFKGAIGNGTASVVFTLPPAMRPSTDVYLPVDLCGAASGRLLIQPSGVVHVFSEGNFSNAQCLTSLDGAKFALSSTGFTNINLENGWIESAFASAPAVIKTEGIVRFKGAIVATSNQTVAFTLPAEMRPSTNVYVRIDLCNAAPGWLIILPSGQVLPQSPGPLSNVLCSTSLDGASFIASSSEIAELQLENGWVPYGFGTSRPKVYLVDGIVHFKGAISSGTSPVVFTLPPPVRPSTRVYVPVDLFGAKVGRLVIEASGEVQVQAAVSFSDAQAFTSLDGATFAPSATGFTELTLSNGWINTPFSTSNVAASMINGIVHFKGAISGGTSAYAFTLPPAMRPSTVVYLPIGLGVASKGRLVIQPTGDVSIAALASFSDAQLFTSLDGAKFAPSAAGFASQALSNGWTPTIYGTAGPAASITRNIVYLRGAIANGVGAEPFTLPPILRPDADVWVPVDLCNAAKGRLHIQPTGAVTVQALNGFSEAQCFTSLDGVSFVSLPEPATFPALTAGILLLVWIRGSKARTGQFT